MSTTSKQRLYGTLNGHPDKELEAVSLKIVNIATKTA